MIRIVAETYIHMAKPFVTALVLLGIFSQSSKTALEEFAQLRNEADLARASGDVRARLHAILKIEKLLNDAPDAIEAAAQAYAEVGDTHHALDFLSQFAELGQVDDRLLRGENKTFAPLEKLPEYKSILKRFASNKVALSRSDTALYLQDQGLLAEDIDYDPRSRSFLITSVLEKKIIRVTPEGKTTDFAQSPSHWPVLAVKVDASHNLVWATEVAIDGFAVAPKFDWGRSAVLCFDLSTGALRQRIEGPAHSALGDMALTRAGGPIVSDGDGGGIYRVSGDRLERIDRGDFISPQTPTTHPDGRHVFIPDYARGIAVVDLAGGQLIWLNRGNVKKYALNGIDGLYFNEGSLIATQNGTSPERVVRFRINSTLTDITSEQIIEKATPTLGDPTHGVVVDDFFYYIANSGWSEIDEHGNLKTGSKPTPARIMRFRLRSPSSPKSQHQLMRMP